MEGKKNMTVYFYRTQNAFPQQKYARDIAVNISHFCIFFNPGELRSLRYLSGKMSPTPQFFEEILEFIETQPQELKYLIVNNHPRRKNKELKYYTNIFPNESNEVPKIIFFQYSSK
jgi:hypothetical protein